MVLDDDMRSIIFSC
uniref:Uncharacterized protein n=1 Tax=Anguilla anguilla TaxID=7936 RepID=A0A0E9QEJ8_ANGAN